MMFTLWDVGHGLSIWIKTPNEQNHWIDAGKNGDTDFSPAQHVYEDYKERDIDYLVVSHPDADHIENLPDLIEYLDEPRVLTRNKTLPDELKYGECTQEYQKIFKDLDCRFNGTVKPEKSPRNMEYNGGVNVKTANLSYRDGMTKNNSSVVVMYAYAGWLFVCPGDIEPDGWEELWDIESETFDPLIKKSEYRILVAPHHGRESGYSQQMMDDIDPHMVLVSDVPGESPTDRRFRENPIGVEFEGEVIPYISTKTEGRIQFIISEDGSCMLNVQ